MFRPHGTVSNDPYIAGSNPIVGREDWSFG
jgi:hypothetical protein